MLDNVKFTLFLVVLGATLLYVSLYIKFYKSLTSMGLYIPFYASNQSFLGLFATQENLSQFHRNIQAWFEKQQLSSVSRRTTDIVTTIQKEEILQPCLVSPPSLLGVIMFHPFNGNMSDLENKLYTSDIGPGGRFKPTDCKATQKLAIIIPYRDRLKHLVNFLNHFIPILKRQQLEFTIYVIDQGGKETFNRGLLLNIGFTEALKLDNYDCFVLHDVDTYPLNDKNMYRCGDKPVHLAVAVEKYGFRLPYSGYYGAVTAFSRNRYEMINGFSNAYFGWGGEDDDQGKRLSTKGLNFVRRSPLIAKYASASHTRDSTNPIGKERFSLLGSALKRMNYDGLNSLIYNVTNIQLKKLYTHITITVDRKLLEKNLKDHRTLS